MADKVDFLSSSAFSFIKTADKFETCVKERVRWSKKQWLQSEENGSRINKLINSLNFWKTKLKPAMVDNSIIVTIFNCERDVKTDLTQIISHIESLDPNIKVRGFSDFRNPRYLCFDFKDKAERDTIIEKFKIMDNNFVVYLHWAFEAVDNLITLKVHWLPRNFNLSDIKKALMKYVKCIEEERINLSLMSGRDMPSGRVIFRAKVNDGVSIDSVPHLINVLDMEALVTIPGRLPLCLNCDILGHVSKKCKLRFCEKCNSLKLKEHTCVITPQKNLYSAVVKDNADAEKRIEPNDWASGFNLDELATVSDENLIITQKIAFLEKQINGEIVKSSDSFNTVKDLKRKADETEVEARDSECITVGQVYCSSEYESDASVHSQMDTEDETVEKNIEKNFNIQSVKENKEFVLVKKKLKGKGKKNTKVAVVPSVGASSLEANSKKSEMTLRSYGKPIRNNARRISEEQKFDKLEQKTGISREFVFAD